MSARVGHYVKIQKIGSGSMGDVFKAWDLREGRWVALKILRSNDMVQLARFIREAQVASQLAHEHITPIYDAGKDNEKRLWYIAMKYIVGHTLRSFPRANRRIVARVMADAARALAYAHEKGVVHRDIKPENFMVVSTPKPGVPKSKSIEAFDHHLYVMDFGIARPSDANTQLTMPGTVMGSPSFMSPEQASGRPVDFRSDVYSLGATLYDRLLGDPPFPGHNVFDVLRRVQEDKPAPPHAVDPSIPASLGMIAMKCLEKDPAGRYQTAAELADALEAWVAAPEEAAPARAAKKGCGGAAAVLLAAAAGAAALLAV
jgi:serine/threonine-protein kinase